MRLPTSDERDEMTSDCNQAPVTARADSRPCVEITARLTAADAADRAGLDGKPLRETAQWVARVHLNDEAMRRG